MNKKYVIHILNKNGSVKIVKRKTLKDFFEVDGSYYILENIATFDSKNKRYVYVSKDRINTINSDGKFLNNLNVLPMVFKKDEEKEESKSKEIKPYKDDKGKEYLPMVDNEGKPIYDNGKPLYYLIDNSSQEDKNYQVLLHSKALSDLLPRAEFNYLLLLMGSGIGILLGIVIGLAIGHVRI